MQDNVKDAKIVINSDVIAIAMANKKKHTLLNTKDTPLQFQHQKNKK